MTLILSSSPGTAPVISNSIMLSSTFEEMCLAASNRTDRRRRLSAIRGSLMWRTITLAPLIAATTAFASMPASCISALTACATPAWSMTIPSRTESAGVGPTAALTICQVPGARPASACTTLMKRLPISTPMTFSLPNICVSPSM